MIQAADLVAWVHALVWPFLRISALFLVAPVFSAASIPVRVRVILAAVIAALLAPLLPAMPPVDTLSAEGLLLAAREVAVGALMGAVVQLAFAAVVVAGESLAMSMGLG
ncbi:MAG: flagellar biosynthetic protein FliR, partial [Parahaliea sp.]